MHTLTLLAHIETRKEAKHTMAKLLLIVSFCLTLATLCQSRNVNSKISKPLLNSLRVKSTVSIFAAMRDGTTEVLKQVERSTPLTASHAERTNSVYKALKSQSDISQKNVLEKLRSNSPELEIESFWIINQVYIKNADVATVELLASMEEVSEITEEDIVQIEEITRGPVQERLRDAKAEWGLENMNVPAVWNMTGGSNGTGIVIGNIDTGVRGTHEAFAHKWVGTARNGWYDPENKTIIPFDDYNHGTLTIGALVGDGGIGVAPGAEWMACKAYRSDGSGTSSTFVACCQFMICPTDAAGNNQDCSKAPHVVSNSWGFGGGVTLFNPILEAWITAGILSSFSAGNEGNSGCSNLLAPADQPNAIAIGAIGTANELASFSSKGPYMGQLKPEISAPGVGILTADFSSDTAYRSASGTSLSCPLASGVLALMKGSFNNLGHHVARSALIQSANRDVQTSGDSCGGIPDTTFPNNHFGYGRLDALATMRMLIGDS